MNFFELEVADISALNDADLRELVARLCEAELLRQGMPSSCVRWGGAQEAADDGVDVLVTSTLNPTSANFVPEANTGFQVKKHAMSKSACTAEMKENGKPKAIIERLATLKGAYIIVSGKDDCSEKMLSERLNGMKAAVDVSPHKHDLRLDFYGRDRLAAWLRRHPSVALWARSRLGKPLAGWKPYGRWAATPLHQEDEFLVDDHPCVVDANSGSKEPMRVLEGIELTRNRLRKLGSTVRITGLSGVGKTRFAQALFEPTTGAAALPASEVIYADLGVDLSPAASELTSYLIANDFASYLVLDNCPPDVHRSLQKQVRERGAKLRLLTIEYDISDDKPEETEVMHLDPTSEKTVSKLVKKRFPDLGIVNADRIAEFAGGNSRVALALAGRVNADETLSNFSDEDLFRRLFAQRKVDSSELLRSAEALALVYSFNVSKAEHLDELSVLGTIADVTRHGLHRDQAELLRRQLAQQRGNWRAILPQALANRLARRALQNIPLNEINEQLLKPANIRLLQSCAHRLGYLHDFDRANELALTWIEPNAPLGDIATCSEAHLVVLDYVAPVFPEVVLRAIELASTRQGFSSRDNKHFIRFTRLLCHIAYEDETFDRATTVLLKFAESEKAGEKNNSVVGQMQQLFSLHLSGTEAKPERRQAFVRKMLSSGNQRHREIARELLSSAFESHTWTSFGPFHFGARKRGHGWSPKTHDEKTGWYVGYIQLLQPDLSSTESSKAEWAKSLLADHFRSLWCFAGCVDALEQIIRNHGSGGNWTEMWVSIKEVLHLDGDQCAPELRVRLELLEKLTAPLDIYSEIEAYVLTDAWKHVDVRGDSHQKKIDEIYAKAKKLGELAAVTPEYLDRLGAKLWKTNVRPISWFGKGLALGSVNKFLTFDRLTDSFREHLSGANNLLLLDGFICGVHDSNPNEARSLLEHALTVSELKPYSVNLLAAVPLTPWVSKALVDLAQAGELEAWRFEQIRYVLDHEALADNELAILLNKINELKKGYITTIRILSDHFFGIEHKQYSPNEQIRAVARSAVRMLVSAHRDEFKRFQVNGIARVLKEALSESAPEREVREIIEELCEGIETYRLYAFELPEVIAALVEMHPERLLDAVFDGSRREAGLSAALFRDSSRGQDPTLNDAPLERVLAWCGSNQERVTKAAKAMHVYSVSATNNTSGEQRVSLSEHVRALLNAASNKPAMVEIIFGNTLPSSWSGSLSSLIEARSKAFAELLEYPDDEVQKSARTKLDLLEQRIYSEREREAEEHSRREQRFE